MAAPPHTYTSISTAQADGDICVSVCGLDDQTIAAPQNFGGPGDTWSPEDLQSAAISSCFCLSFRAIARAGKLPWRSMNSSVELLLDKAGRDVVFTEIRNVVNVELVDQKDKELATKLLRKAEETCFISASMTAKKELLISFT